MSDPIRVLVVEDQPDDAELVILALRRGGLEPAWERVETAEGLAAALAAEPWDAVLADYTLPGFGALAALAIVRARDPDLPFVIVSGTVGEEVVVEAMRAGASDYVLKRSLTRLAPAVEREVREADNRRARRAAERAAAHLAAVVVSSFDAIISKTLDGVVTSWNPAAERLYGWTAAEAVGRHVSFLVPPDKVDELAGIMARLRRGERVQPFETVRLHRDGRRVEVALTISPVLGPDGQVIGASKVARDITDQKKAEAALRRSEERLRRVVESDMLGTLFWRATGEVTDANDAFLALVGYTREDIRAGRVRWADMTPPEYRPQDEAALAEIARTGRCTPFEKEYVRADGSRVPVLLGAARINGEGVAFALDLTARKRAEAAQRESEARFRSLVEQAPFSVQVYAPDGQPVLANRAWEELWGVTLDHIPEYNLLRDPQLEARGVLPYLRRAFAGETVSIPPLRYDPNETLPGRTRHAHAERWVATIAYPVRDNAGRVVEVVVVHEDVTDRVRAEGAQRAAEESLRRSEAELRTLVDAIPEIVWVGGPDGANLYANARWREYTGDRPDDPLGAGWERAIHPDDLPAVGGLWAAAVRDGTPFQSEHRLRRHDGAYRWHLVRARPSRDADGQVARWYGTCTDIDDRKEAEGAVREAEERFRAFMDHCPAAAFVKDDAGRLLYVNAAWRRQFHPEPADWAGRTEYDFWPRQTADLFRASDLACLAAGRPLQAEETGPVPAGGEDRTWLVMKFPLGGGSRRIGGMAWDVTDRTRAEASLRASEERYRSLADAMPQIVWVTRADGYHEYYNRQWYEYTGQTPEQTEGEGWSPVFHPDDQPLAWQRWRHALASGEPYEIEYRCRRHDGAYRWFLGRALPHRDADGRILRWFGTCTDIDDQRRAGEALRLRDRAIRAVTQGILITDPAQPDNPIVYTSPGFERMTGYPAAEVLGRNCRLLQGKDTDRDAVARVREAIRGGDPVAVELLNYRKDGTPFWNELSVAPVRDDAGRLTHFVGVQTDVTARKRLEEQFRQAQKMEAVGQLAGGVAHDFNNLLTIINGYSDLLLQGLAPGDPSRELLAEIHKAGERSAGLTRQLLAFSRQQVLAPRVLDLNAVATDAEKMLRRIIGEDIQLATALGPGLWSVKADPGQLEQVLLNLAVNARDAMPTGGRLTIETRNVELDEAHAAVLPDARPGPYVLLAVSDTGCGMTPEVRARVFEPFFTTKGPGKGTGLGLATVYGIVKQSGGHVDVYSEVGVGTTFKVYLPRAESKAGGSKILPGLRTPPGGSETVLLVEDEEGVRALTRHVLARSGYAVLEAADGDEAVGLADRHPGPIHLVVTDVVMPGRGGRQVAERVRARHPGARVLYVSGYTDDAVVRHGVLHEGVNFLQKPFSPVALAHKVREVLDSPAETDSP